jgi:hypothetical protein
VILRVPWRRIDMEPTSVTTDFVTVDCSPNVGPRTCFCDSPPLRFSILQSLANVLIGMQLHYSDEIDNSTGQPTKMRKRRGTPPGAIHGTRGINAVPSMAP